MAAVVPLIRVLPAILRLFAPLRQGPIVRGKVIPLKSIDPASDTELQRALNYKLKVKKREEFNDRSRVVTIQDVIDCYEETANGKVVITEVALGIAAALLLDRPTTNVLENFGDKFVNCVRDKALKQTSARKRLTYRYSKREL